VSLKMVHDICIGFIRCSVVTIIYVLLFVSGPLYLLQTITILRHRTKHFATQFYTFIVVNAISDGVGKSLQKCFIIFKDALVLNARICIITLEPVGGLVFNTNWHRTGFECFWINNFKQLLSNVLFFLKHC
jgi:hypothetical protein